MNEKEKEEIIHLHPASKKTSYKIPLFHLSLSPSLSHSLSKAEITSKEYPAPKRLRFIHVTIRFDLRDEGKTVTRTGHSSPKKKVTEVL